MHHNTLQYHNTYYKNTEKIQMDNPLSCLVANTFLSSYETKQNRQCLPQIWLRYIDDVFAVFNKKSLKFYYRTSLFTIK